jgi:UDP-N-acetylmuramoyl-L-alanyl-D-glutamate--2,6-diaminopimelate ligase
VFGCGGDRDRTKRPLMARAAELGSTVCILTSDNPRNEDPQRILDDAKAGFRMQGHRIIEDRRAAIAEAIDMAEPGDVVLIAGKGHENYQEIKGVKHAFSDSYIATGAFHRRGARAADKRRIEFGQADPFRETNRSPRRETNDLDDNDSTSERRWNE